MSCGHTYLIIRQTNELTKSFWLFTLYDLRMFFWKQNWQNLRHK